MITVGRRARRPRDAPPQLVDRFAGRDQDLSRPGARISWRTTIDLRSARPLRPRDQGLGELEGIEIAAKPASASATMGTSQSVPELAVHVMNLVGAQQRVVDALDIFGTESTGYRLWSGYTCRRYWHRRRLAA